MYITMCCMFVWLHFVYFVLLQQLLFMTRIDDVQKRDDTNAAHARSNKAAVMKLTQHGLSTVNNCPMHCVRVSTK